MEQGSNLLIDGLNSMTGTKWVIIGVVLLILELITGTSYILWPAAAALIVGLFTYLLPLGWEMQFLLFFLLSAALLVFGHIYIRPKMKGGEPSDLNDRARSMVGMRVKAIADFETGEGRVQVGDTQWRAQMETGNAAAGQELRVLSVKATTLIVEPS
ncbi:MAG: NfeD family protein [Maricaulaceae bacterium]